MKTKNLIIALFAIASMLTTSCKKAEQGPKGDAGAPGTNGNANVKTTTVTVQPNQFYYTGGNIMANADIFWTTITQDIVSNGSVQAYMLTATNTWAPMPITIYNSGYQTLFDYSYTLNKVSISIAFSNLNTISVTQPITFKIVATAGTMVGKPAPTKITDQFNVVSQ